MDQLNPNGFIIQDASTIMYRPNNFKYFGINAFPSFPLTCFTDELSRSLSKKQQSRRCSDGKYERLEFISDPILLEQYLSVCQSKNIPVRVLFVESRYEQELWIDSTPDRVILGFEYCPLPVDEQIISDVDWYPPLKNFWTNLNSYGLFSSYQDAQLFQNSYDKYVSTDQIGDGIERAYIMRISVVSQNSLLKLSTGNSM